MDNQTLTAPYTIPAPAGADRSSLAVTVLASCKTAILPHLANAGIAVLRIEYDGSGDDGGICQITAFDQEGKPMVIPDVNCERHTLMYSGAVKVEIVSLTDALENLAETAIEALHEGWENNEGAFAVVQIVVETSAVTLEHNERFVTYTTTQHDL